MENPAGEKTNNRGCKGPHSMYIKLIAEGNHEIFIRREDALLSPTLVRMMVPLPQKTESRDHEEENDTNVIYLPHVPFPLLCKVCEFFHYKKKYANSNRDVPDFPIRPDMALGLLYLADFLEC